MTKDEARAVVAELVEAFQANEAFYTRSSYNETQARTDFITPLLGALGWDVRNDRRLPPTLREVVEEANVSVEDDSPSRRPDYELRLGRTRKLFVEAKKPWVKLLNDPAPALQARRYGFSASMPIVVLTSFRQLVVYDSTTAPRIGDGAHVARLDAFACEDLVTRFDDLWEYFSREVIYSGRFDKRYETELSYRGSAPFDELFLEQVCSWRQRLAVDIYAHAPELAEAELTYAVQIFLSRLVFLRICEDRGIEGYEQLRVVVANGFGEFKDLLRRADDFFDSGLFDVMVDERLGTIVSDGTLASIVEELYYPQSPYTFSVVETEVLGHIYERFLGEVISINGGKVSIEQRPEIRESGGVVPTPREVVDEIVARTINPLIGGRSPDQLANFTVLDMCCGSGIFLLAAFEQLCDHYLDWFVTEGPERHAGSHIEESAGGWRLSYRCRRNILLRHIRGVDIDADAVEVAQLSLLLKLIEGETRVDLDAFVAESGERALPDLAPIIRNGNSLVARSEWEHVLGPMSAAIDGIVKPFDWDDEFPVEIGRGGFAAVVGNPPYIRIQNMTRYSPDEVAYYQHEKSPFVSAGHNNFDKYALFIERGLDLLMPEGRLGLITPHKFMSIKSGEELRRLVAQRVKEIVHFGSQQVFPGVSNYTSILICGTRADTTVQVERVPDVESWRRGEAGVITEYPQRDFTADPWRLSNQELPALLDRLKADGARRLTEVADIFVGVQTSCDEVFIVRPLEVSDDYVKVESYGGMWDLERGALRPCLNDVQITPFVQPEPNRWIIFPYYVSADGRVHLLQPDEFAERFPNTFAYLEAHRDRLANRNISGGIAAERQWYQYGRTQSLAKFGRPKIILPVLSLEPRYAPDYQDIVVTGGGNGPYYLIRPHDENDLPLEALLAILNHPLAESVVRSNTSVFRGGYYSHGKQYIADVLVPDLSDHVKTQLVGQVVELQAAQRDRNAARTPVSETAAARRISALGRQLWSTVDAAFGLADADRELIANVPMP